MHKIDSQKWKNAYLRIEKDEHGIILKSTSNNNISQVQILLRMRDQKKLLAYLSHNLNAPENKE